MGTLRVFAITKPGLAAMTLSVVALWTCIAMERTALERGALDARDCAAALAELRERSVPMPSPVSSPAGLPASFRRQLPKAS